MDINKQGGAMAFHPIHVVPDIRGALSETYAGATAQLKEFVIEHQGTFLGAVEGDDAEDDGLVFVDLPEDAIRELGQEEFVESIGTEIERRATEPDGDIQDGFSDRTALEPHFPFH